MYSKELIKKVYECYPDNVMMQQFAEEGSPWLGKYIDDSMLPGIPVDVVLNAVSLGALKVIALREKQKRKLYQLWFKEYYSV